MTYVFIATPMYGGMCHGGYTASMLRVGPVFMNIPVPFQYLQALNDSLVTSARNTLTYQFLATECTHLMFIDSDIGFQAEDILSMIEANKDIICGLYPRKTIDWGRVAEAAKRGVAPHELHEHATTPVVGVAEGANPVITGDKPVEVLCAGAGFMLIKRHVLEGLADKVPDYNTSDTPPKTVKQYFDTGIDADSGDRLLSEDYQFCKTARNSGYKVWAAPWVELSHTGTYQFTGSNTRSRPQGQWSGFRSLTGPGHPWCSPTLPMEDPFRSNTETGQPHR